MVTCCRAGGGGCLTTGSWHPLHAGSASPAGCWQLGRGGGGLASPQVVGGAPQWGVDQVGEPAGTHARTPPGGEVTADLVNATGADAGPGRRPGQGVGGGGGSTGQRRLFLTGPCQFMARGAQGWVPTLAPGGSWSCCCGGGGGLWSCFAGTGGVPRKVSSPPMAKPTAPLRWGTTAEGGREGRGGGVWGGEAVHTQGGTHKRRPVATAGVLLFEGPQARRCTQKAVHTQGGTHKRRSVATAGVLLFKEPKARRYTQKAVHTQGGAHTRRNTQEAVCSHRRSLVI